MTARNAPTIIRPLTDREHCELLDIVLDAAFATRLCARHLADRQQDLHRYAQNAGQRFFADHRQRISDENLQAVEDAAYEQIELAGCGDCDHE